MKDTEKNWASLTDLALERGRIPTNEEGITHETIENETYRVERLAIESRTGEGILSRPIGRYYTVSCRPFHTLGDREMESVTAGVRCELERVCAPHIMEGSRILFVGLGNGALLPDSIGVAIGERVRETAGIKRENAELFARLGCAEVMILCPSVEARTGICTAALIRAAAKELSPALIIAADALATRSYERLCATVQISDTGIFPGSGLGQRRERIDQETVGVPVVAVGIPTVEGAYAYALEVCHRGGVTDLSRIERDEGYLTLPTLAEDVDTGAKIVANAINLVCNITF